jgi:hypothetical protein
LLNKKIFKNLLQISKEMKELWMENQFANSVKKPGHVEKWCREKQQKKKKDNQKNFCKKNRI